LYLHSESLLIDKYTTRFVGVVLRHDDEHLAYELAEMGENATLVSKVFDVADRDDSGRARLLACYYVETMTDFRLKRVNEVAPEFIARLERMLATPDPASSSQSARTAECLATLKAAGGQDRPHK